MEKRTFIAIGLSILILIGWQILFPPPKPAPRAVPEPPATAETSPEAPVPEAAAPPAAPAETPTSTAPVEATAAEAEETLPVENDLFEIRLSNRGGTVVSWKLRDYTGHDGEPLELVSCYRGPDLPRPLEIDLDDAGLAHRVNDALYTVERDTVAAEGESPAGERVRFRWADGRGLEVVKTLVFRPGDYLVSLDVEVTSNGRRLPARVAWGPGFAADGSAAKGATSYYAYRGQAVWDLDGTVTRTKASKVSDQSVVGRLEWAGLEDQYFAALVIPEADRGEVRTWPIESEACTAPAGEDVKKEPTPMVAVSVPPEGALLFVGPKKYTLLHGLGHELARVVWFATNEILAAIAKGLFLALLWIHHHVIANWGVAIILATFALRLVLFPVNQYSMVRMKKAQVDMQRVQPKVNAIKAKYAKKKDAEGRAKMNQETMDLYRREGINPMGGVAGCLPLLLQFPILIGFYNMLTVAVELRGAPFYFWIHDLSIRDPYYITPLLMGATMFLQQRMSMTKSADPAQRQQQMIMMIMPVFFTYLCIQMPSGMVLYWFVNNLLGIGQQWLVNRHTGRLQAAAQKA